MCLLGLALPYLLPTDFGGVGRFFGSPAAWSVSGDGLSSCQTAAASWSVTLAERVREGECPGRGGRAGGCLAPAWSVGVRTESVVSRSRRAGDCQAPAWSLAL